MKLKVTKCEVPYKEGDPKDRKSYRLSYRKIVPSCQKGLATKINKLAGLVFLSLLRIRRIEVVVKYLDLKEWALLRTSSTKMGRH